MERSVLRILDANLNRAREAFRVMEEFARFALNDASLTTALKEARHRLSGSVPGRLAEALSDARNVPADPGREATTPSELTRADARHVAVAAGKRLGEALRALEEYAKPIDSEWAAVIKSIRYEGYLLEQRLIRTRSAIERLSGIGLYVLITEHLSRSDWFETAKAVLDGGADAIQLREKSLSDRELLHRASRLNDLCRERRALFFVNDRPDVAALCHASGVHLGQDDLPVSEARSILPAGSLIGISTHSVEQVRGALEQQPDYVAVGPMFPSSTRPQEMIAGPATLAAVRRFTALPLVAIGGITPANVSVVLAAAPCTVCVSQAVIGAPDARTAAAELCQMLNKWKDTQNSPHEPPSPFFSNDPQPNGR
jgi:thiamine-phosphate pyrophosphorylase